MKLRIDLRKESNAISYTLGVMIHWQMRRYYLNYLLITKLLITKSLITEWLITERLEILTSMLLISHH